MNGNIHNSRGSSTRAMISAARWRTVFLALVLALTIGSVGQTPAVQAAPAGETELRFWMHALKEGAASTAVCVGGLETIQVLVYRYKVINGVNAAPDAVTGVRVTGRVDNPKVGQISPEQNTTVLNASIYTGAADFVFHAKNPGETTITFVGTVATGWFGTNWGGDPKTLTAAVNVKVIPCKFKVKTVLQFSTGFYNLAGISSDAVMIADEQGHLTGSASMSWAYSNVISGGGPCRYSMLAADSQVDLVGQLDEDGGQVMTTATFQPTTVSSTVSCPLTATGTGHESATVHPLTFTVDSSGGVSTQTATAEGVQGALELEGPVSGTARVILIPEEDEAVSFIPGDHEASVGPPFPRWAMQWDDFSSLFGALLALH